MNTNIDISKQYILYILNKMYIIKMIFTYIGIANEVKKTNVKIHNGGKFVTHFRPQHSPLHRNLQLLPLLIRHYF